MEEKCFALPALQSVSIFRRGKRKYKQRKQKALVILYLYFKIHVKSDLQPY